MIKADKEHIKIISEILTISLLNYSIEDNTIIFPETYNISTLENANYMLTYSKAKSLWNNMVLILTFLEKRKLTIAYLDVKTTYVVNNLYLIPTIHFLPIKNNNITINHLYNKADIYLSTDLEHIEELPASVPIQSIYNSLAKYIMTNMFGSATASMNQIYGTKLYWLLHWCLQDNSEERHLLSI
jgi:hypothetical protein